MSAPATDGVPPRTGRRRLPGINLRPGAVKQARQEAGLSLAKVGAGHVTAPAIFLIETGRTRPSLPTLEHIARRTGKPVDFFLADPGGATDETQAGLLELEAMLAEGRFAEAVTLGQRLVGLASSAHRLGRIRYFLAEAHMGLGQMDLAATLVREAHAHFEAGSDDLMLAECLGLEAKVAYATQKPGALQLAERALAICRGLQPVPHTTESRLLSILATVHVANREWESAIKLYEEAIEVAGSLYDLRRLATTYSGLSLAYRESGQVEAAARYAGRTIALLEVLRDRRALARAENNLGLIRLAQGDTVTARTHLDRSLELSHETDMESGRSHVLLSLSELSLQEGNREGARQMAVEALRLAERLNEGANVAEAHIWLGRVAAELGDDEAVDTEFDMAIRGLTELGMTERLLRCHGTYAEILEKRGNLRLAYAHMKSALSASRPGLLKDDERDEAEGRVSSA
ncbi:MAG TPA: tetratricopeptide repeat protein [Candidatus Dormibacteraeota bacterium]|nr:tetratricopeptide repeat protein [Candidatus Dormibacteraeota bacterium]